MPYRDDEAALQQELAHWQAEHERLSAAQQQLSRALEARAAQVTALERRLIYAGPESGTTANPHTDRIALAAWTLIVTALPWLYFQGIWQRYILRDPTVIPALLWLGSPGWLAALVALPYWRDGLRFRVAAIVGLLLGLAPLVEVLASVLLGARLW